MTGARPVSNLKDGGGNVVAADSRADGAPSSHVEALKSTSIMGGSMALVMLIRMVRTKVLAVLLGPAGIGLEAILDSIVTLAKTITVLGVSNSGVRQIAAAVGTGDKHKIATTVVVLRRVCLLLGILGALSLVLARELISTVVFGDVSYAFEVGCLAVIPLFGGIAGGQGALLQGMRRIGDLARINIYGAVATTLISVPIVWIWGKEGIPAYLILIAIVGLAVSWFYVRKIGVEATVVPVRESFHEAKELLRLGFVFVASGLMTTGVLFLLRVLVTRQEGVDGAGQFQAANALSMVYVGFVLQAMGTDFYPRLTAVADDNARCNQLVNDQAEISMLLSLPGILASIAFAPWIIDIFYSTRFNMAAEILCWQVAGMLLRVNSWPMGYIVVAKGRSLAFFLVDLAAYSVYAVLGWVGLTWFGLPGTGMAFLGLYIFHWCMIYVVVGKMSGFRWSRANIRLTLIGICGTIATLSARLTLIEPWATIIGAAFGVAAGLYCLREIVRIIGPRKINSWLQDRNVPFQLRGVEQETPTAEQISTA